MENLEKIDLLFKIRHSAAHILAQAVTELFPQALPTIGPVTQDGFFYDFFLPVQTFCPQDLEKIEKRMFEIAKKDFPITGRQISKKEAREMFSGNPFKLELIDQISEETVGVFWQSDFYDLCRGGHVESLGQVKHFKLTSVAGAHWRADVTKQPLQRIYGIAFQSAEELSAHLKRIEEAKLYDHRVLGKKLDLFSFSNLAPGVVFYHDKGTTVYNLLIDYVRGLQQKAGYQEIRTPLLLREELFQTSGHCQNYKENMFYVPDTEKETADSTGFIIKPMNCPPAMLLFDQTLHSYKELPIRFSEFGICHRKELSGVLHGMFRVRSFTMDDAHIFCTVDQIEDEVIGVLKLAETVYKRFGFSNLKMAISTKPENSIVTEDSEELWQKATQALENALKSCGHEFQFKHGDGAFYGPKIEILITDAMGREWQCGTVQVDFFLPPRFGLSYVDSDQSRKTPVAIHRAIYGSIERFFGMILEHFHGRLPFWLCPVQAVILPITSAQQEYASQIEQQLSSSGIRVTCDLDNEKISAKIRTAQLAQIPWMLVIGAKEQEAGVVTLRNLDGEQSLNLTIERLIEMAKENNSLN